MKKRDRILALAADLPGHVFFYDRKEDEDLPRGALERALETGLVTPEELVGPLLEYARKFAAFAVVPA